MPETTVAVGLYRRASDGRYLVQRRAPDGLRGGLLEFPGGKVDAGEMPEQALIREWKEELGVDIEVGLQITETVLRFPDIEGDVRLPLFEVVGLIGAPTALVGQTIGWAYPSEIEGDERVAPTMPEYLDPIRKWVRTCMMAVRERQLIRALLALPQAARTALWAAEVPGWGFYATVLDTDMDICWPDGERVRYWWTIGLAEDPGDSTEVPIAQRQFEKDGSALWLPVDPLTILKIAGAVCGRFEAHTVLNGEKVDPVEMSVWGADTPYCAASGTDAHLVALDVLRQAYEWKEEHG